MWRVLGLNCISRKSVSKSNGFMGAMRVYEYGYEYTLHSMRGTAMCFVNGHCESSLNDAFQY